MDLNEILTKERDSLRDENIELRKRINELDYKEGVKGNNITLTSFSLTEKLYPFFSK